jgi:pSer/pThr/pTyr-binding forkhead associated (FHA) protein
MTDVTLNIYAEDEATQVLVEGSQFTIGSSQNASVQIDDEKLSPIHASINRSGEKVWVLNESGTDTVFVNNNLVSPQGTELKDNDRLTIGNHLIVVRFNQELMEVEGEEVADTTGAAAAAVPSQTSSSPLKYLAAGAGTVILLAAAVGGVAWYATKDSNKNVQIVNNNGIEEPTPTEEEPTPTPTPKPKVTPTPTTSGTPIGTSTPPVNTSYAGKQYKQMTDAEKNAFITEKARHISRMMSNSTYEFTPQVIPEIKKFVDGFANRVGNNSQKMWAEDTGIMFKRAQGYAPYITSAFNEKGVPPVVGLYLVVVETEYRNIRSENFAGAAGLFQFICPTARGYGVACEDRTNIEKMAPAAAAYLSDRISEFGVGPMSVALSIAGYNRSPDSVRRDLHDVINADPNNKERSFWNLVLNSTMLDHWFQGENIKYVPKFFGAAIVGENPTVFGLEMLPLSDYKEKKIPLSELP